MDAEGWVSTDDISDGYDSDDNSASSEEEAEPVAGGARFDPAAATRHEYLGEVDDVPGGGGFLEDGTICQLPVLPLQGVVLLPGSILPLRLARGYESELLRAMTAPQPFKQLLAVLHTERGLLRQGSYIGCTAEIRQVSMQQDQTVNLVATGRQRVLITVTRSRHSQPGASCCVLTEGCTDRVPRPFREHLAYWDHWATRSYDVTWLAAQAQAIAAEVLPSFAQFKGTPLELSYWLASNLPVSVTVRQQLLEARDCAGRLKLALQLLLAGMARLCCSECGATLAQSRDVLSMTLEGTGGTFVNQHGYVHDMVTFRKVSGVVHQGSPSKEFSWFPGYAWTLCYCKRCGQHLGWRFTTEVQGLTPASFWGIRRPSLTTANMEPSVPGAPLQYPWGPS